MKINSSRRLHLINAQLFTYVASAYVYMQWMVAEEDWLQTLYCQTNKSFSPNACKIFFFFLCANSLFPDVVWKHIKSMIL